VSSQDPDADHVYTCLLRPDFFLLHTGFGKAANTMRTLAASSQRRENLPPLGIICASEAYTRATFLRLTGMTRSSFTSACRNGLRAVKIGKRVHVLGRDWIEFLATRPPGASQK
jgi:hypothetical protein